MIIVTKELCSRGESTSSKSTWNGFTKSSNITGDSCL